MQFIGNVEDIEKDILANLIYDKLSSLILDEKAVLYYQYPFYRGDIKSDFIEAKLLLVSPIYGLFFFEVDKNETFTEAIQDRVDTLYNEMASRMLKHSSLRSRRNQIKYERHSVIVGNYVHYSDGQEEYMVCKVDDISTLINENKLDSPIPQETLILIESCIDGTSTLNQKKERSNVRPLTKASILNEIQSHIANFDIVQKKIAEIDIDLPQRIRGLAGSGKTIVLAYKAARFHAQYPDKKILYTFYTKSLATTVKNLINRAFKNYSSSEPDWNMIKVCHGWGSSSSEGVYYNTCINNGYQPMTFAEARRYSDNAFAYICKELYMKDITKEYDLILIDEGQDFPSEFYRLCYKLCNTKRICWAYDDFQNIFDVEIQNEQNTFGFDSFGKPYIDFSTGGNSLQDQVLMKCYRTPRYSLIYAFALGLGIYNEKILQRLESNKQWESLGFKVEKGNSQTGDEMIISRPEENTPSYSNKEFTKDSINVKKYASIEKECCNIADEISRCIQEQGLLPTDICVICIDSNRIGDYFSNISIGLRQHGINPFNLLNAPYNNTTFFSEGRVTLSSVNKAKGNECGMVFICGIDSVFKNPNNVVMRDKLFTSMTRTKGWLHLSGCGDGMEAFLRELKEIEEKNYKLVFIQPDRAETKNIENVSRATDAAEHHIFEQIRKLRESGLKDEEIQKIINGLLFPTK